MRIFEAENGNRLEAINDVQVDAFLRAGFVEVEPAQKRPRKEQTA